MVRRVVKAIFSLLFVALISCGQEQKHQHCFYYWQFDAGADTLSKGLAKNLDVQQFYVHYMDVDWSENAGMPVPRVQLQNIDSNYITKQYTPVIYITNAVFQFISNDGCDTLAIKLAKRIAEITANLKTYDLYRYLDKNLVYSYGPKYDSARYALTLEYGKKMLDSSVQEIQIDCDWTAKTKDKYFLFLKQFKKQFANKNLSATIRLYPYKYPDKMGIPPVDKGVLMCYNMGSINNVQTYNSVFSYAALEQYINDKVYPLPLDVALPVFGWHAWFRGNKFKGIIYETQAFTDNKTFASVKEGQFMVTTDTVINDTYYREGDIIRAEYPDSNEIIKAMRLIDDNLRYQNIIFYYWNPNTVKQYEHVISKIYSDH